MHSLVLPAHRREPQRTWSLRNIRRVGTCRKCRKNRNLVALSTAICEITEWKIPYGNHNEVSYDDMKALLAEGTTPELTEGNPAEAVVLGI
ncbi:hypothetical protein QBC46DRAFT_371557 [Diplogelasinospora grovesii]|uniref:Uncharacterized protein n=1 Tax=Diplogelasinospora grovesii TaxID=303347 RepID=A0AAN6NI55_9PEZI|nr:hypothetical protein QBC46DRAFT_371557 [Diplogelasinospora grovesii]